jgi:hypothetical protein
MATIGNYLRNVAQFFAHFLVVDVRKVDATQLRLAPVIQAILDKVRSWEKVPDKREPFTPAMWTHIMHAATSQVSTPHLLGASICDWFGCGLFVGFRLIEWAQEAGASSILSPLLDDRGVTKAFCLPDIEFRLANNKRASQREAFDLPDKLIHRARITFTHQKNGNNGEQQVFVRTQTIRLCVLLRYCCASLSGLFSYLAGKPQPYLWLSTKRPPATFVQSPPTISMSPCAPLLRQFTVSTRPNTHMNFNFGLHTLFVPAPALSFTPTVSQDRKSNSCCVGNPTLSWLTFAIWGFWPQNVALSDSCDMPNLL